MPRNGRVPFSPAFNFSDLVALGLVGVVLALA
jgi:hypothetical protein